MTDSKIEWTDRSDWNPVRGCTRASEGCRNCYAEVMAARFSKSGMWGHGFAEMRAGDHRWTGKVELHEDRLLLPLRWKKPAKVFASSTSDIFHESLPDAAIDRIFAVMALCPHLTFQVLTKRSARIRQYSSAEVVVARIKAAIETYGNSLGDGVEDLTFFSKIGWETRLEPCKPDCVPPCNMVWASDSPSETRTIRRKDYDGTDAQRAGQCYGRMRWDGDIPWPLPNVWLGVSVEDQQRADERIPDLLATPAAVRFISAEPLLGPINLRSIDISGYEEVLPLGAGWLDRLDPGETEGPRLDWVIVGGESGSNARPMSIQWARELRDQCAAASVPFFFKQWGCWAPAGLHRSEEPGRFAFGDYEHDRSAMVQIDHYPRQFTKFGARSVMQWVGKKAAGRLLDGVEHNGMPLAASVEGGAE